MSRKISIFMPVYNGGNFLDYSIPSVLNQDYQDWELLCVDDESTDGSAEKLDSYAQHDARIVVYHKPHGGNVPKSWNFILPKITSDYVMYLSQDDMLGADALGKMVAKITIDVDAVLPQYRQFDYGSNTILRENGIDDVSDCISGLEAFALSLKWHIHGFCLYRRSLFDGIHLDDTIYISDEWMTRKLFLNARKVAASDAVFLRGNNPLAITRQPKAYLVEGLVANRYVLQLFGEYHLPMPLKIYWLALCFRHLHSSMDYIEAYSDDWSQEDVAKAKKIYNGELGFIKTTKNILLVLFCKPLSTPKYIRMYCEKNVGNKLKTYLRKILLFRYTSLLHLSKTKSL